jgi:hypothetical protein
MARTLPSVATAAKVEDEFNSALTALVEQVKRDSSILAAILCGSLSHDTVWSKSDIDLVLVTIDDKKTGKDSLCLYADGINVHAILMPRADFRKAAEGALRNSFMHSLLAKGRLLYSHDETIAALCARLQELGERDTQLQLLAAANALAKIEVLEAGLLVDREALPQALKLNPSFFKIVYTDLLNTKKTVRAVEAALEAVDGYLLQRAARIFAPIIEHLAEVGEARSATEIDYHFQRNFGIEGVSGACEYLADQGLLGKAPLPVRLTKRSNIAVNELAFFCATSGSDAW